MKSIFDQKVDFVSKNHIPTKYQKAIFDWLWHENGHAVVNAVAGSGKTTTLMDCLHFIKPGSQTIMVAFNKHIADELNSRNLPNNTKAATLHSVGFRSLKQKVKGRIKVDGWKIKKIFQGIMCYAQMNSDERKEFWGICHPVVKMVSLLKNFGYGSFRPKASIEDIQALADRYAVDISVSFETFLDYISQCMKESVNQQNIIDFDDMLYLPIKLGVKFFEYDYVFVDESQDLNPIQIEIVRQMSKHGRAIFVGDRNQAIYGFRGADVEAIDTIIKEFNAKELPLSICWRCPVSVVTSAREIVPQIEPSTNAVQGEVCNINEEKFEEIVKDEDYVLCRTMAPLVQHCLRLIRDGKKAIVRGRDIGTGLKNIIDKIASSDFEGSLLEKIELWGRDAVEKIPESQNNRKITLEDQIATLLVLSEKYTKWSQVKQVIDDIFSDSIEGITFATIHRAKGLESDRVFVLRPDLLPHPMAKQEWEQDQETNLKYVAITRAMKTLVWVKRL